MACSQQRDSGRTKITAANSGQASMEFALIVGLMLVLLCAVIDFSRAISYLRNLGQIAIILVEQYLDFAQELGDHFAVMDRGQVVYASTRSDLDEGALKRAMAI